MKTVRLQSITLRNFKGIKHQHITFSGKQTTLIGDNRTGKTSTFDAFNFLLWGKNSANETSFGIKTLDSEGKTSPMTEHEVNGTLLVDGDVIQLKKVYKEKWTKKRGSETSEMTGNDTLYFINDVPKSAGEYKAFVDGILDPSYSRLITDPLYFNTQLKWDEKRSILTRMAGEISDMDVAGNLPNSQELINLLNSGKSFEERKKEAAFKKKSLKEELDQIPARIDEVDRSKPIALDWEALENDLRLASEELESKSNKKDSLQAEQNKLFDQVKKLQNRKFELESQIQAEINRINVESNSERNRLIQEADKLISNRNSIQSRIDFLISESKGKEVEIEVLRSSVGSLRNEWNELNAKPIESSETVQTHCPSCQQPLPEDKISTSRELIAQRANQQRKEQLQKLTDAATEKNRQIQALQAEMSNIEHRKQEAEKELELNISQSVSIPDEIPFKKSELLISMETELSSIIIEEPKQIDDEELSDEISRLRHREYDLKAQLQTKQQIENCESRITELLAKQRELSQQIADIEKVEMQIDNFNKEKISMVEKRVNGLFRLVKFKIFEQQINGGETPTCVCTVDGVPFSDLNTASKINAGLDIINAAQKYFQTYAPVFIDNRESVTEIQQMDCQIINLLKVEGITELTVK